VCINENEEEEETIIKPILLMNIIERPRTMTAIMNSQWMILRPIVVMNDIIGQCEDSDNCECVLLILDWLLKKWYCYYYYYWLLLMEYWRPIIDIIIISNDTILLLLVIDIVVNDYCVWIMRRSIIIINMTIININYYWPMTRLDDNGNED